MALKMKNIPRNILLTCRIGLMNDDRDYSADFDAQFRYI